MHSNGVSAGTRTGREGRSKLPGVHVSRPADARDVPQDLPRTSPKTFLASPPLDPGICPMVTFESL